MTRYEEAKKAAMWAKVALEDKKAMDVSVLDVSDISSLCDFFVIATGSNVNQLRAMADNVCEKLETSGIHLNHMEGNNGSDWVLLDFNSVIIHIFNGESRTFYNLERLFGDAKQVVN